MSITSGFQQRAVSLFIVVTQSLLFHFKTKVNVMRAIRQTLLRSRSTLIRILWCSTLITFLEFWWWVGVLIPEENGQALFFGFGKSWKNTARWVFCIEKTSIKSYQFTTCLTLEWQLKEIREKMFTNVKCTRSMSFQFTPSWRFFQRTLFGNSVNSETWRQWFAYSLKFRINHIIMLRSRHASSK